MLRKSTFREIRTSLARYLAIFAIVALGVGFFSGLKDQPENTFTGPISMIIRYSHHTVPMMTAWLSRSPGMK